MGLRAAVFQEDNSPQNSVRSIGEHTFDANISASQAGSHPETNMSTNASGIQRGYELAYAEAQRWLEDQERTVVELRSRAGTLMAAATITTSFFGGQSLIRHDIGASGWVAAQSSTVDNYEP